MFAFFQSVAVESFFFLIPYHFHCLNTFALIVVLHSIFLFSVLLRAYHPEKWVLIFITKVHAFYLHYEWQVLDTFLPLFIKWHIVEGLVFLASFRSSLPVH